MHGSIGAAQKVVPLWNRKPLRFAVERCAKHSYDPVVWIYASHMSGFLSARKYAWMVRQRLKELITLDLEYLFGKGYLLLDWEPHIFGDRFDQTAVFTVMGHPDIEARRLNSHIDRALAEVSRRQCVEFVTKLTVHEGRA